MQNQCFVSLQSLWIGIEKNVFLPLSGQIQNLLPVCSLPFRRSGGLHGDTTVEAIDIFVNVGIAAVLLLVKGLMLFGVI